MRVYATSAELATWLGDTAPDNAESLLRSASILVADYTGNDWYDVDDDGLATDTTITEALRDATCAQAEAWIALDIDPAAGAAGAVRQATSKKLGSGQITYSGEAATTAARADAAEYLAPAATSILRQAGLGSSRLVAW